MKGPSSVILAAILLDLIFVVPNGGIGLTQGPQDQPDLTLRAATRAEVIEGVRSRPPGLPYPRLPCHEGRSDGGVEI
jgi:hypothetical protein